MHETDFVSSNGNKFNHNRETLSKMRYILLCCFR